MTTSTDSAAAIGLPSPSLSERLLIASNGVDEAKALCWAVRMAASDLQEPHRDGIRAIEDALMDRLEAIGREIAMCRVGEHEGVLS